MGDVQYAYAPAEPGGARRARRSAASSPTCACRAGSASSSTGAVYHDTARDAASGDRRPTRPVSSNHLFRAEIHLEVAAGAVAVSVSGARGEVRKGAVRIYADDAVGKRRAVGAVPASTTPASLTIPAGSRRIAAVLRGEDDAGELVAVSERPAP